MDSTLISDLPLWISCLFLVTVFLSIALLLWSTRVSKSFSVFLICWGILHCVLAYNGFYQDTQSTPPRFAVVLIPVILILVFTLRKGSMNGLAQRRDVRKSTFLHTIRVPMEIFLASLFAFGLIPIEMTYHGFNFDIIAGISAPIVGILYWKDIIGRVGLIAWNVLGAVLILTIFSIAILSTEIPIQQFGFEQPNIGLLQFPFILLPAVVVPLVIHTHLSDIMLLCRKN